MVTNDISKFYKLQIIKFLELLISVSQYFDQN